MKYLMENKRGRSGITLISLVITVIVLLIVAGVAISVTLDGDGLFSQATKAKDKWNLAIQNEEATILGYLDNLGGTTGEIADIIPEIDGLPAKKTAAELAEYIPIYTIDQLKKVATGESIEIEGTTYTMTPDAKYALINDLDFSTVTDMKPIKGFTGTFEGNGCTITNLSIDVSGEANTYTNVVGVADKDYPAALFETVINGTIKNLAITNATIKAKESVAAIVGQGDNVTIDNCYVKDSDLALVEVSGLSCGGIIGFIGENGANISNCKVIATTIDNNVVINYTEGPGGICGVSYGDIKISDCEVWGNEEKNIIYRSGIIVWGKNNVDISNCKIQNISFKEGGIISVAGTYNSSSTTSNIINCSAKNVISVGSSYNSPILQASLTENTNIENCKVDNFEVTSTGSYVSAIVTTIQGKNITISGCTVNNIKFNTTNSPYLGGILGSNGYSSDVKTTITNCVVNNIVSSGMIYEFGGIVRVAMGETSIENCRVDNIDIKKTSYTTGGIIASSQGTGIIKKCNVNNFKIAEGASYDTGGILGNAGNSSYKTDIRDCNITNFTVGGSVGGNYCGGIAGFINNGSINNCNAINVKFDVNTRYSPRLGGALGGTNTATINNCTVKDSIIKSNSTVYIGGICGFGTNASNCTVENTEITATGQAQAIGGIIGHGQKNSTIESLIQNCKVNNSTITGYDTKYVGGISGAAVATISKCSVVGSTVTGATDSLGGIQGFGGAIGTATGASGSTTSVVIENCDVTNCQLISNGTYKDYIQGRNSYDENNVSNDRITNCTHEGTTLKKVATEILNEMPTGKGWNSGEEKTVDKVVKQGSRVAPIPKGYTISEIPGEDSINRGMVVYQIPDGATVDWENNQITLSGETTAKKLQENVNQYVWIPVDDINDMVMCKKNGNNGTCNLVYEVSSNQITCQTHGYTTSTELSDDENSPDFIDTTGLAGRLYATGTNTSTTPYTTSMAFTQASKDAHKFTKDAGYREPDLVTALDNSNYQLVLNESSQALTSANALKQQLNNKFIEMAKSVAKYGGFYISRYEPSYENSKVISKKNKAVLTAASSASGNYLAGEMWYGLYNKTLNNVEKDASVNSHMIWGCQYDQVIKFLGSEAQTGHNYQTTSQEVTGYTGDQNILNNIYDLEGNDFEWTAQAYSTSYRVFRGGYYFYAKNSYFYPASYRGYHSPNVNGDVYTTRPTLYVK